MERVKNYFFGDVTRELMKREHLLFDLENKLNKEKIRINRLIEILIINYEKSFDERLKNLKIAMKQLKELYETIEDLNLKGIKTGLDVIKVNSRINR